MKDEIITIGNTGSTSVVTTDEGERGPTSYLDAESTVQKINQLTEDLKGLESKLDHLNKIYNKLEIDQEQIKGDQVHFENKISWIAGTIVIVFAVALATIAVDLLISNVNRYENLTSKILEFKDEMNHNFYSKEELNNFIDKNTQNTRTLDCLKSSGFFAIKCLK